MGFSKPVTFNLGATTSPYFFFCSIFVKLFVIHWLYYFVIWSRRRGGSLFNFRPSTSILLSAVL